MSKLNIAADSVAKVNFRDRQFYVALNKIKMIDQNHNSSESSNIFTAVHPSGSFNASEFTICDVRLHNNCSHGY